MRARDMMVKLDRLPTSADDDVKLWDLSLLAPEDQDRARELMRLIGAAPAADAAELNAACDAFRELVRDLPLLGLGDEKRGPLIEVPRDLARCWTWRQTASGWLSYHFSNLSKVQTLRLVHGTCWKLWLEIKANQKKSEQSSNLEFA
jgi:hypothetical protein